MSLSNIGMLLYCSELLTLCASCVFQQHNEGGGPHKAALMTVPSKLWVPAVSCRTVGEQILDWNAEEQFLHKNSICSQSVVLCTWNTSGDMHARDVICSFMGGEHLKPDTYMSSSFPEIKRHNGNHKVKKKIPKCLLFLLNPLLPLEEASVDFCSPSIELQFLIHYSFSAKMVTQVKSSLAFCLLGLFLCINMCFDSVSLRKPPSLLRWVSCPHRSFLGVAALGDVAARIYMGFSWEGWCVGVFFAA